jgi:dienelactone hydrolase
MSGVEYSADRFATGGTPGSTTDPIVGAVNAALYQTERYGNVTYEIPVTNATYELKLHFVEMFQSTEGARQFSVTVEGVPVLQNFDLYAEAGHDVAFDVTASSVMVADESLTIELTSQIDNATISGFAIYSSDGGEFIAPQVPDSPLPPVSDYSAMGPFQVTTQTNTGPDGSYTIIRPRALGENGFLHAPIIFGPGTGMEVSQMSNLLQRIASHGFVIISRQLNGGPGDAQTRQRMTNGLDWLIAQNSVAGSPFQGKLLVDKATAMGYSVGGTGSIEIGGHPAIATVVAIHGHSATGDLKSPVLMLGGTQDVMSDGRSWMAPSYEASRVQTFFGTVQGANHGYIQNVVNGVQGGVETPAIIAWIRYWIYNDEGAKHYFYGNDCVMCVAPWTNPQRKNWQ